MIGTGVKNQFLAGKAPGGGGGSHQPPPESPFNLSATVDALLQPHAGEKEGYRSVEYFVPFESASFYCLSQGELD